jgi:multidrug efflux pump subunit AcrB
VQIPQAQTNSIEDLQNVPVTASGTGGRSVLLRNVAQLAPGSAPGEYERYNLVRVVSVTANLQGIDLGTASKEIAAAVAELGEPPAKSRVDYRGQVGPLNELSEGFKSGLLVAVAVIFLLLTANFQSLRLALVVTATVPGVLAGVAVALTATHTTLNLQSAIGAIMAIGVAVANAILLVTFAERERRRAGVVEVSSAAHAGALSRLRPVLMTSFAMAAGMLPMAIGAGEAGEQVAPLGRAVLGGLAFGTLATLFILPPVFTLLAGKKKQSASLDPDDEASPLFETRSTRTAAH